MSTIKPQLRLISHKLCPYAQRVAIALFEKRIPFERVDIDLANKPDWFLGISPLGKVPVLLVDGVPVFESAVILEYLEDRFEPRLHPGDTLDRARHRAWIEFGSAQLALIAGLYNAPDRQGFQDKADALSLNFARLAGVLGEGPYFAGPDFSLVDAVYAPIFRYFDIFDAIGDFGVFTGLGPVTRWRQALADRSSVRDAVAGDYPVRLREFLVQRESYVSTLLGAQLEAV
ncbi:glutathione S-transferase [Maricaulis sp. W15]|uniref:glutathione S-transferase family protein n=1 Tax=Maricaulis sp. W15 TaxID=1772333 RepID=UPI000948E2B5|nr:glutathione S-transferase family protein [Maricaulis sp. W15]OLF72983.1 glutathione S-transferase [Maricaulis sp. W15]